MSEPLHDIDQLFFDNIEGHTEYPPKKIWDKIEADLEKKEGVVYKKKYEKIKRTLLLLLFLISGILLYEIFVHRHGNDIARNGSQNTTGKNIPDIHDNGKKTEPSENNNNVIAPEKNTPVPAETNNAGNTVDQTNQKNIITDRKYSIKTGLPPAFDWNKESANNNNPKPGFINKKADQSNAEIIAANGKIVSRDKLKNKLSNKPTNVSDSKQADKQPDLAPSDQKENEFSLRPPVEEKGKFLSTLPTFPFFTTISPASVIQINAGGRLPKIAMTKATDEQIAKAAKNASLKNTFKPGLTLSFLFSPNATWSSLQNDAPHRSGNGRVDDHHEIQQTEHNDFSYTGSVKLNYSINKKWTAVTGLNYTSLTSSIDPKLIYAEKDNNGNVRYRLDCSSGYTFLLPGSGPGPNVGDSLRADDSKNTLSYAGIPLVIEYRLLSGKFSLSVSAGGQANILLKGKTTTVFGKGTSAKTSVTGNTQALKPSWFSILTGIGGEMKLNNKISITLTPLAQFGVSPINNGGSVKTRSNNFGIGAGIKLRL